MAYKGTPPKITTEEYRRRLVRPQVSWRDPMCWEAVLAAFGQGTGYQQFGPRSTLEIVTMMRKDDRYTLRQMDRDELGAEPPFPATLATFIHKHPAGDFLIFTPGHVIALRSGKITDTVGSTSTVRRGIQSAWEVTAPKLPAGARCHCSDPIVFGHWDDCPEHPTPMAVSQ